MMNTAALENIERHLSEISERSTNALEHIQSGIYDKSEGGKERSVERIVIGCNLLDGYGSKDSISELTERVLRYVQVELNRREDRSV
jgi:hypothetical protein